MPQLAELIRQKYPGAYDNVDDATLEKQVLAKYPQYRSLVEPEQPKPEPPAEQSFFSRLLADNPALPPQVRAGQFLLRKAKDNPVQAAAVAGGALAVPLTGGTSLLPSIAAAGLGGAGGAGLAIGGRQLATGRPESAKDTAQTMATEGAAQAVGQGIGGGMAKFAGAAAPRIMRGVLRPTRRVQDEFGDVVGAALKEKVPIGQSGTITGRLRSSAGQADELIKAAEQAGAPPIKVKEVTREFKPVAETLKKRTEIGLPDDTPELAQRGAAMYRQNKQGIPLTRAQELKREAQDMASRTFRAIEKGNPVKDTTGLADKAVATGLRKAIEQRVPGVAPVNARTQSLMGLQEAMEQAESRNGGIVGLNPLNWLSGAAPNIGSRMAFTADSVSRAPLAGGSRALMAALMALMGSGEQEPEGPQ